jgi:hypothetical protein
MPTLKKSIIVADGQFPFHCLFMRKRGFTGPAARQATHVSDSGTRLFGFMTVPRHGRATKTARKIGLTVTQAELVSSCKGIQYYPGLQARRLQPIQKLR